MKKFSIIIALTIMHNCMFAMDSEIPQNGGRLQGVLKPVAGFLYRNLEQYHEFAETSPYLADLALRSTMIAAKGLIGMGIGAVDGGSLGFAICGPGCGAEGAVIGGAKGFAVGVGTGIKQEFEGAAIQGIFGKPLDALVERCTNALAPQIMKLDRSLDEQEAKILACCVIGVTLHAAEFKTFSKEILHSFKIGTAHTSLAAMSLTSGGRQATQTPKSSHSLMHTGFHKTKTGLAGSSLEKTVSPEHRTPEQATSPTSATPAAQKEAQQNFTQAKDQLNQLFTETMQEEVQETVKTSKQIAQIEKQADKAVAAQEMQNLFQAVQSNIKYEISRNTIADTCECFSSLLSIAGDHKAAYQIATIGQAGIKLMDSCRMLATGTSAVVGTAGAFMIPSPTAPITGIASAVASLMGLFDDDDDSSTALEQAIQQMYQALSQQIAVLHNHMIERFDKLEDKVDRMHLHMIEGFVKMSQQIRDFKACNLYALDRIEHELQTLHTIDTKVDSLLLRPFVGSCSAIERFASRQGSLREMDKKEVLGHYQVLENGLLGIDPKHELMNGHICSDFSPHSLNRILVSSSPEGLLGYLAKYKTSVLGQPMPVGILPEKLPHLGIFAHGLERYLELRTGATHVPYDPQGRALQDIAHAGQQALTFVDSIQTNQALFEKLFANYKASYEKVMAVCNQAFEKRSQELLDTVHAQAVERNRREIAAFPAFPYADLPPNDPGYCGREYVSGFIYPFLIAEYQRVQQTLCLPDSLAWLVNNKLRFKVSLTNSQCELVSNPDNSILSVIIGTTDKREELYQPIPLGFRRIAHEIEKTIPMEAIIAERLGLGNIELTHCKNPNDETVISLSITFRKNDQTLLNLGEATYIGSSNYAYKNPYDIYYAHDTSAIRSAGHRNTYLERSYVKFYLPISPIRFFAIWASSSLRTFIPAPESKVVLSALIDARLTELRQETIASLSASTELGIRYKQALEELDASYNAIQAFDTVAGAKRQALQSIPGLMNGSSFNTHMQRCITEASGSTSLTSKLNSTLTRTSAPALLTQTISASSEASFSTTLRIMLAKLGKFSLQWPEIQRIRQEEELAEKAATERALTQKAPTAKEIDLSKQVELLTQQVQELKAAAASSSSQMAAMMALMQQMLAQKGNQ